MPWTPCLLATAVVGLAMVGCASQPKEAESEHITKRSCAEEAANPLHLTTMQRPPSRDPAVESLLTEQTSDPRLMYLNRQMYQTLHALDVELRREQDVAACERNPSDTQTLQAQSSPNSGAGSGVGAGGGSAAGAGAGSAGGSAGGGGGLSGAGASGGTVATTAVAAPAAEASSGATTASHAGSTPVAAVSAVATAPGNGAPGAGRTAFVRKSSLSPSSGGGNGATAQKVVTGSDNDIVARRLRRAAEQETDPVVKARLWKEYAQYQQGSAVK